MSDETLMSNEVERAAELSRNIIGYLNSEYDYTVRIAALKAVLALQEHFQMAELAKEMLRRTYTGNTMNA